MHLCTSSHQSHDRTEVQQGHGSAGCGPSHLRTKIHPCSPKAQCLNLGRLRFHCEPPSVDAHPNRAPAPPHRHSARQDIAFPGSALGRSQRLGRSPIKPGCATQPGVPKPRFPPGPRHLLHPNEPQILPFPSTHFLTSSSHPPIHRLAGCMNYPDSSNLAHSKLSWAL